MRMMLMLAACVLLYAGCALAQEEAATAPKPVSQAATMKVEQPTKIPGNWKLVEPNLPPIEQILRAPAAKMPVYGLYGWCGEYKDYRDDIRKVGWKSVRIGGPMDDEAFKMMCEDGVEVMKTLGLRDVNPTGDAKNRAGYDADEPFIADYVAGVERFMARYGPGGEFFKENPGVPVRPIMHVEIWNEPNFQYMIPDREPRAEVEKEREALYAKVLPAAYRAIKAKWPTVTVVGFGAGGASKGDIRFIKHVHENSPQVAKSYDVLSTHPYQPPVAPEVASVRSWGMFDTASSLKEIREILSKHGRGDAPIWYTEVGWPISQADGGRFPDRPNQVYVTPLLQAAYVVREYALAMRLGVERVHIMFTSDSDGFNGGFFARGDKKWRPSAHAVQNMIHVMPNPKLTETISEGADGYYAYVFQANRKPDVARASPVVVMVWNVTGPKTVELPVGSPRVTVMDMLGGERPVKARSGKIGLEIGPCPVYVLMK